MSHKQIAVLLSDVHFTPATLELAAQSFLKAQFKAKILDVPLIVCGDTLDSKAVMRAECVNRLLELVSVKDAPDMIFVVGNHDLCNEKGKTHSLNFLKPYATVVETIQTSLLGGVNLTIIPYQSDPNTIKNWLEDRDTEKGDIFLMHQGVTGSDSGDYIHDKSAIPKEWLKDLKVWSGHYHNRQTIALPSDGEWNYIGNPYSLSFGEANDKPKGYQILMSDGTAEFVPTNLRKHVIYEITPDNETSELKRHQPGDLVWVKAKGPRAWLSSFRKESYGACRLTTECTDDAPKAITASLRGPEALDSIIDQQPDKATSDRLKSLWRQLCE